MAADANCCVTAPRPGPSARHRRSGGSPGCGRSNNSRHARQPTGRATRAGCLRPTTAGGRLRLTDSTREGDGVVPGVGVGAALAVLGGVLTGVVVATSVVAGAALEAVAAVGGCDAEATLQAVVASTMVRRKRNGFIIQAVRRAR